MDFAALLHFSEQGGVVLASGHQKKAAGFAVESANQRKELVGKLVAEPVDECKSSIGAGWMDEPSGRFIHNEKVVMLLDNGRRHSATFSLNQISTTFFSAAPWHEIREMTLDRVDEVREGRLGLPVARKTSLCEWCQG